MPLSNFRQVFLPYGFRKVQTGVGRLEWLPFNRERSPLGCVVPHLNMTTDDFDHASYCRRRRERVSDFEEAKLAKVMRRIEKYMDDIAFDVSANRAEFYLYDDGCLPDASEESWNLYQLRLAAFSLAGSTTSDTRRLKKIIAQLKDAA
jgi:hypothetical protein